MTRPEAALYVVTDVHGFRAELHDALLVAGLIDDDGHWAGADAGSRLWFLGDYVDRGPDGIGVIDDIGRWQVEAAAAGGEVGALLGNHEAKLLAARRFGPAPVNGRHDPQGFFDNWRSNGGQAGDLLRLSAGHVAWIESLPAVAVVGRHLLLHSDTTRYLELGHTVDAVNAATHAALLSDDSAGWAELMVRLSDRGAFRETDQQDQHDQHDPVSTMLDTLGGEVLVHGHTTLSKLLGVPPIKVSEAWHHAGGRVVAVDGGVYEGGPMLVTRLV